MKDWLGNTNDEKELPHSMSAGLELCIFSHDMRKEAGGKDRPKVLLFSY